MEHKVSLLVTAKEYEVQSQVGSGRAALGLAGNWLGFYFEQPQGPI